MSEEDRHPFLPEQDYETDMTTYDFIYFVQDYSPFLREYLDYLYDSDEPEDIDNHGYYTSFIDICNSIYTVEGDDGTFETYYEQIQPFMEFMTEECGKMNAYYEESMREIPDEEFPEEVDSPKGVASRTRSKRPASGFEIPPPKRGTNMITLEPTKQEGVRIKLSDGQEYTHDQIKDMWRYSKTETPYRHPYTADDKQKIIDLIDLVTKGGKTNTRKGNNTKKSNKGKSNKGKSNKRKSNKRKSNKKKTNKRKSNKSRTTLSV